MNIYQRPYTRNESIYLPEAAGQYAFQVTAGGCPFFSEINLQFTENSLNYCSDNEGPFTASITCQNIGGTYTITVGNGTIGAACSNGNFNGNIIEQPILSVSPHLPSDCIIDTFVEVGSSNQDVCDI